MRKWTTILGVVFCVLHILTETHSFVWKINPKLLNVTMNLFIVKEGTPSISVIWYLKMIFDDFLNVGTFGIFALFLREYSLPLSKICWIWCIYHTIDIWSFIYDYKASATMYWAMLGAEILTTTIILLTAYRKLRIAK